MATTQQQKVDPETRVDMSGDPWHLFWINAADCDGTHAYVVSAQSGAQEKAQELAEGSVLEVLGTADDPAELESCQYLGITDTDTFVSIGILKP
jgi:hypothetical protein